MPGSGHAGSHQSAWCGGAAAPASKAVRSRRCPASRRSPWPSAPLVTNARTVFGPPHFSQTSTSFSNVRLRSSDHSRYLGAPASEAAPPSAGGIPRTGRARTSAAPWRRLHRRDPSAPAALSLADDQRSQLRVRRQGGGGPRRFSRRTALARPARQVCRASSGTPAHPEAGRNALRTAFAQASRAPALR